MKSFWFILFLLIYFPVYSQVQLRDRALPKAGDTSLFFVDNLPSSIDPGQAGPNQRWNFMTLQSPFVRRTKWAPSEFSLAGNRFKQADLSLQITEQTEAYYQKNKNGLFLLGYYGEDPFGLGIKNAYTYQKPVIQERKNVRFGDKKTSKTSLVSLCTLNDLPKNVRKLLPITPDSIRISMTSQRIDEVDAWGNLLMPGGFFDVLREKRSEARSLKIETKLGTMPWQDITRLLNENDIFGEHVFLSYHFYSEEFEGEPILRVFMKADNKGVDKVIYRAHQPEVSIQDINAIRPGVYAYPNPAIVSIRFEFTNLSPGTYQISIMNVLGVEIWSKDYFIHNNYTEKVDVSFLRKGTYLYALKDNSGKILSTKRIVIIRP